MAIPNDIESWIRTENGTDDSVGDQVEVAGWFWDHSFTLVNDRFARTSQVTEGVEHRLDHQVRTCLDNLEGIGVLLQFEPPGSGRYIRHHRTGQNFYDPTTREYVPLLEEDLSRLLDDLASDPVTEPQVADGSGENAGETGSHETLRSIAAEALDVGKADIEDELTGPADPIEQMNRYDKVVKAIKESQEELRSRNYDEMGWRNSALRWTLSERAAHMEANHSLPV